MSIEKIEKQKINEAINIFGKDVVVQVVNLVNMSDSDGVYSMYKDMEMEDHAECVEFLYFE